MTAPLTQLDIAWLDYFWIPASVKWHTPDDTPSVVVLLEQGLLEEHILTNGTLCYRASPAGRAYLEALKSLGAVPW